ncbi:LacI family DNA-binding transcriptional regulator [Staphylococcus caeli]|uniref:Transcriptional regulator n=1 Tax=Staphylococcus caeli TaxID=2201815 RepID=A0A1D4MXE5_9STAP|nr:LacI family DNA-binding transcriptional regulator [Staphylococcus caeli]SCT03091.1 transcriptional regulator [Staphylococcus caeli]SCT15210.1 transcriptional regulator [Staphylococcus caeli]
MTTIKDIAKLANVSPSTVSRVISGNSRISLSTQNKIKKIMTELDYQPNKAARTLVTQKSKTIGIIHKNGEFTTLQNPFIIDVLSGVFLVCKINGYGTIATTATDPIDIISEVKEMIFYHSVDGFILLYSKENDEIINILEKQSIPYVVIGKPIHAQNTVSVDNDNITASAQLTQYLIELGHIDFLFIAESERFEVVKDRVKGHEDTLKNAQLIPHVVYLQMNQAVIFEYLKQLHYEHRLPTIIITSDTMINHMVLSTLYELSLHIPKDIQTATFNDSYINAFASPPQTTVDIHPQLLGETAGKAIMQLLNQEQIEQVNHIIQTDIITRTSTQRL